MFVLLCKVVLLTICLGNFKLSDAKSDVQTFRQYAPQTSNYDDFFHKDLLASIQPSDDIVNFQIYVQGHTDAHILLAPSTDPKDNSIFFEIALGTDANTKSAIRCGKSMKLKNVKVHQSKSTPSILKANVMKPVGIRITKDAKLEVTHGSESKPILVHTNTSLLEVKYVSFLKHGLHDISFFYGCHGSTT